MAQTFNAAAFKAAEELQSKAYRLEESGEMEKAHFAHLKAESAFLKLGEAERAAESEARALSCIEAA